MLNQFDETFNVRKSWVVNADNYICNESVSTGYQYVLYKLFEGQFIETERVNVTTLGEMQPLRGYPINLFYDSYTNSRGDEPIWHVLETQDAYNFIEEKWTFADFMAEVIYEEGILCPNMGAKF